MIVQRLTKLRQDLRSRGERGRLTRATLILSALKIAAIALAFLTSLFCARILGPHDYGLYAFVIAWASLLAIPAGLGLPLYLIREGARFPNAVAMLRRWADTQIWLAGIPAGMLIAAGYLVPAAADARPLFLLAAPLPLLLNLTGVRRSLLQARGWIARSQWSESLLAPIFVLTSLGALWLVRGRFTTSELIALTSIAALLTFIINSALLRKAVPSSVKSGMSAGSIKAALPFMWIGGLYLLMSRTDLIMLGSMRGARDTGIYSVAARAAELLPFISYAAITAVAPRIASLHHAGETGKLQQLLSRMGSRVLLATVPLAIIMVGFAEPLLHLLYGSAYADSANLLRILAIAQLAIVVGGPLDTLLDMSGHEKHHMFAMGGAVVLNATLNFWLIPWLGATGAAYATCTSIVLARIMLFVLVRKTLSIRPTTFGL